MEKRTARQIADGLTWARVVGVIPITILAWYGMQWWVFGLYIAAALTDLFDGYFARRGTPSTMKIDFDGNADLLFTLMTLLWLWLLFPEFVQKYWLPYLPILVLIQVYLTITELRRPDIRIGHFQFGRFAMALFCFLLPVLIAFGDHPWFVHAVLILGIASKLQLAHFFFTHDTKRADAA